MTLETFARVEDSISNIMQDLQYSGVGVSREHIETFRVKTQNLKTQYNRDSTPKMTEYYKAYNAILTDLGWGWKVLE